MLQWLGVLTALQQRTSEGPSTHAELLVTACNSSYRGSNASGFHRPRLSHIPTHRYIINIYIIYIFLKKKF